jgi:hypothetical protein
MKWTKKECLNCEYYDTFDEFKTVIDNKPIKTKQHENIQELETLLTFNFQLYNNVVYDRAQHNPKDFYLLIPIIVCNFPLEIKPFM